MVVVGASCGGAVGGMCEGRKVNSTTEWKGNQA